MRVSDRLGMPAADVVWMAVTALLAGLLVVALAGCSKVGATVTNAAGEQRFTTEDTGVKNMTLVHDHATGRSYLLYSRFRTGAAMVEVDSPTDGPIVYDRPAEEGQ